VKITPGKWSHACDSYGKVRHSKKACVFTVIKDNGKSERIATVAARISNFEDAKLMAAAKELYEALKWMNHVTEGGYCICPLKDGMAPDTRHATSCADARRALRKAESDYADWQNDASLDGGAE
jgi:hypothetical protein